MAKLGDEWEHRTDLRLLVLGASGHEQLVGLESLIEGAFEKDELSLTFETDAGAVNTWIEQARRDESTLLIAVVDTRHRDAWHIHVVDAAHGQAATRRLPGGTDRDHAALEAVASIVVSATVALQEGRFVDAAPPAAVVQPQPTLNESGSTPPVRANPWLDTKRVEDGLTRKSGPWFWLAGGFGPMVAYGWSPQPSAGGRAFVTGRGQTVAVEAGFETSLPSRFELRDGSGFEMSTLAGTLTPCVRYEPLAICSVLRVGHVKARGFGVAHPREPAGVFSQAGLRLSLARMFPHAFETAVHAEIARTLSPWTVQLGGSEVFRLPAYSFLLGIDLSASLFVARTRG